MRNKQPLQACLYVAVFACLRAFDECPRPRKCEAFSKVRLSLSEKSGSPLYVLKEVERIAKKRVSSAKTVPKTPANLEFVGENSLTYEVYSVNIIVEKVLPIDGQPK